VWGGAVALILIALAAGAAVLRGGGAAERACAESGGVWNFEERVCAPPHGAGAEGR
jgi:hypothetical protein